MKNLELFQTIASPTAALEMRPNSIVARHWLRDPDHSPLTFAIEPKPIAAGPVEAIHDAKKRRRAA